MKQNKVEIRKSIFKIIISFIVLLAIVSIGYVIFDCFGLTNLTQKELQDKIESFGPLGPIIYILISFLQVTFIPIPGSITILAGNYLFGFWLSYLYSFIGMFLGSLLAFFLGRVIGRRFVNWIVGDPSKVDEYLKKLKGKETVILFFMFLLPMFPDDVLCSIAGITPMNFIVFIFIQIITRFTSIGSTLFFMSGEIIPYNKPWGIAILIFLTIITIILFIIALKNSDKINDKLIKVIRKLKHDKRK